MSAMTKALDIARRAREAYIETIERDSIGDELDAAAEMADAIRLVLEAAAASASAETAEPSDSGDPS